MLKRNLAYKTGCYKGLSDSISISLAGALFGLAFGVLAHKNGLSLIQTFSMSASMYAGAAQIIALKSFNQPYELWSLLLIILAISARYCVMGFSLRPYFSNSSWPSLALSLFTLMDENWALTLVKAREQPSKAFLYGYFIGAGALGYSLYVAFTILGYLGLTKLQQLPFQSIDFIFCAIFIAMLCSAWRGKKDISPWIASFVLALIFKKLFPGSLYIVSAGLIASLIGLTYEPRK